MTRHGPRSNPARSWWPFAWPRWRLPWQRPDDPVSDEERDQRHRALTEAILKLLTPDDATAQAQSLAVLARVELSLRRAHADRDTLATALPSHPDDAELDRWCAALLREIIRRRHVVHHPDSVTNDVWAGIHILHCWIRGLDPSERPLPPRRARRA